VGGVAILYREAVTGLGPGFSLGGVILRASPRKGAGECRGNPYRPHPNSDDHLLRPFRPDRVYCNATQAKAWAKFPKALRAETAFKSDRLLG
jgi:hypothetical protein